MDPIFKQQIIPDEQQPTSAESTNPGQQQNAIATEGPYSVTSNSHLIQKHKIILRGLGIAECILGGFSIVLAIAANGIVSTEPTYFSSHDKYSPFTYSSQGIWSGILMIITGILGIRVVNKSSTCTISSTKYGHFRMAIITALITFTSGVLSGIAARKSRHRGGIYCPNCYSLSVLHAAVAMISFVAVGISRTQIYFYNGSAFTADQEITHFPGQTVSHPNHPGYQQLTMVAQQPSSVPTENEVPRQKYKKVLGSLGVVECVLGAISILLAIAVTCVVAFYAAYYHYNHVYYNTRSPGLIFFYATQGIWCGIFLIVTGILGIRVKTTPSKRMYIANMTMAIITATTAFSCGLVSILATVNYIASESLLAVHLTIAVICFSAMFMAITHSALCCGGVYYKSNSDSSQQGMYNPQQSVSQPPQQYIQCLNGEMMTEANQPVIPQPGGQVPQYSTLQQAPSMTNPMPDYDTQPPEYRYEYNTDIQPLV